MSEHRPHVVITLDVFPEDNPEFDYQFGAPNDPEAIAKAAWSDVEGWASNGYLPVVTVVTEDGSFDVDLQREVPS